MTRALRIVAATVALMAGPAALAAAPAANPAPSKAQVETAAFHLKVLLSALQSKEVDEPVKNALFVCLYENPFGKMSDATTKVIEGNKLDPKDPNKVLTAMAGVCGLHPGSKPGATPSPAPKPGQPAQPRSR